MFSRWLTVLSLFPIPDLIVLISGKLRLAKPSENFYVLNDKKNKLDLLYLYDSKSFRLAENNEVIVRIALEGKTYSCNLRLAGSDVLVFQQVVISKEYEFAISGFKEKFGRTPSTVVDAGANIGLVIIFFKAVNADTRILAIEPDQDNYRKTQQNILLNNFSGVELLKRALWPTKENLLIVNDFRDKLNWSLRVKEDMGGNVGSITPSDAIGYFGDYVDLFKIDIEGGESEIFKTGNNLDWLLRVRAIAIEIHEEQANRKRIIDILESNGFTISSKGELTLGINTAFLKDHR
jgi:FkbM family methyltransferase